MGEDEITKDGLWMGLTGSSGEELEALGGNSI